MLTGAKRTEGRSSVPAIDAVIRRFANPDCPAQGEEKANRYKSEFKIPPNVLKTENKTISNRNKTAILVSSRFRRTPAARFAACCLALLLLAAVPAAAQSILPTSFAGWSLSAKGGLERAPLASVPRAADGSNPRTPDEAWAALQEYGLVAGERNSYTKGSNTLDVTMYRMKDPSGAYGEYSYLRTQDMPYVNLAEHSAMSRDRALILCGNLVLDVEGHELPKIDADLRSLVATVAPRAEKGLLPTLTDRLPLKDLVERSDRYVLGPATLNQLFPVAVGNSMGFSQGAEAELAHYRAGERDVTLLIVDFPTPQTASKKLAELQQQFNINDSKQNSNVPVLYAKRSLTLLAFVAGAKSRGEADVLLKQVQSDTELTWNEPTFAFTQPNIGTIVVGTIIGTGVICMFALISGLAFGGVRLIVKRTLPDKVFDRSDQLQILQLGLSSKPINAEDFYGIGPTSKI